MPCYYCEKNIVFGRSHTHHRGVAGGRWKKRAPKTSRIFRVNLQPIKIMVNNKIERVRLCTKCLKRIKKDIKEGKKPFLILADQRSNKPTKQSVVKTTDKEKKSKPISAK